MGSQCLLPLINFLELSLSRYHKTWLICQPRRHCQHLLQGELVVWEPVPHEEVGHRGAQSKLRLPHSALSCDILAASAPGREAVRQRQGSACSSTNLPASFSPKAKQGDCIQLVSDITLMSTQAMCSQLIYFCPLPWLPLHSASVFTQTYPIKFWRIALQPPPLRAPACLPSPNQGAAP